MATQITSLTIVYTTVYSGTDQRKHQRSASLVFVWGVHRWPMNAPHNGPVMRKMFQFDDVILTLFDDDDDDNDDDNADDDGKFTQKGSWRWTSTLSIYPHVAPESKPQLQLLWEYVARHYHHSRLNTYLRWCQIHHNFAWQVNENMLVTPAACSLPCHWNCHSLVWHDIISTHKCASERYLTAVAQCLRSYHSVTKWRAKTVF